MMTGHCKAIVYMYMCLVYDLVDTCKTSQKLGIIKFIVHVHVHVFIITTLYLLMYKVHVHVFTLYLLMYKVHVHVHVHVQSLMIFSLLLFS